MALQSRLKVLWQIICKNLYPLNNQRRLLRKHNLTLVPNDCLNDVNVNYKLVIWE